MTYRFKQANEIYTKEIDQLVDDGTISRYIFTGTKEDIANLRTRVLAYGRTRDLIFTTTQKEVEFAKGIHIQYGGKLISKKPTRRYDFKY